MKNRAINFNKIKMYLLIEYLKIDFIFAGKTNKQTNKQTKEGL